MWVIMFGYSCKPVCVCVVFVSVTHTSHTSWARHWLLMLMYYCVYLLSRQAVSHCLCVCVCGYASLLAHSNECHVMLLKSELLWSVKDCVCVCERVCLLSGSAGDWLTDCSGSDVTQRCVTPSACVLVHSGVNAARILFTFVLARELLCVW